MSYDKINNLNSTNKLSDNNILVSVSGFISQRIVSLIMEDLEKKIDSLNIDKNTGNIIMYIAVEQLQNILNYSSDRYVAYEKKQVSDGSFIIGFDEDIQKYYISSSNEIVEDDKGKITAKIDNINSFDKVELKNHFKKLRKSGEDKHQYGAGIGLVNIAMKSSEKLKYNFENKDDELYFNIKVYV
jgi:hypothetical protein